LASFDALVSEFNETVGADEGIILTSISQGSIDNLADSLIDSVNGKAGAADVPNLAAVYSETAYILNQKDMLTSMDEYFTTDELNAYIPSFIEEGRLVEGGNLMIMPISKSTDAFIVNTTDWAGFEEATGVTVDSIKTIEDLVAAAKEYYDWTDSLTPDVAEDGKSLYGRDSVSNYIYVGAKELGHQIFTVTSDGVTVDMDKDTFKKLWDNYYIPFINGYFGAYAKYRSEDCKTGAIISLTGSTSGISYIPTSVTLSDDTSHDINIESKPALQFADAAEDVAVQQGAGFCVTKATEEQEYASMEFLKWFTEKDRNLQFSIGSGYSPVTKAANTKDTITEAYGTDSADVKSQNMLQALLISADVYNTTETYTSKPFEGGKEVRSILESSLRDIASTDRESVLTKIAAGASREEAVADYSTDEYFETWFNNLVEQVNTTVK
jgi:multiple sugar transport system substrate-binding protein